MRTICDDKGVSQIYNDFRPARDQCFRGLRTTTVRTGHSCRQSRRSMRTSSEEVAAASETGTPRRISSSPVAVRSAAGPPS
jgi:hypothetical protein